MGLKSEVKIGNLELIHLCPILMQHTRQSAPYYMYCVQF